ncbi:hypothetical protein CROQUDRAFT_662164 [Cronartium quercuum f. sp. fusiforme G11]|uniref:Uncharacterized protein n=1 Tax=Cronartium quercuum f. sp. fusiforme G11 TaxID=708437 RepID=A0A9P6T8L9_9BASI|nr:hypothetical protein CROQUDRAFT_662164 [Cronartium quercuum f. sp. fusiforme G11]
MSLATGIVLTAASFLLGAQFTHWSVDHRTLWTKPVSQTTITNSLVYYSNLSLSITDTGQIKWVLRIVHLVALIGFIGLLTKLRKSSVTVVFDLASLVLFLTSLIVHIAHVIPLLSTIPTTAIAFDPTLPITFSTGTLAFKSTASIIRTIQSIASLNAIISVTLTGLIGLQLAQIGIERSLDRTDSEPDSISIPARATIVQGPKKTSADQSLLLRLQPRNPLDIRPASSLNP